MLATTTVTRSQRRAAIEEMATRRMRDSFEAFFRGTAPRKPYHYGKHTLAVLHELDKVTRRLERGLSTYLIITIPPRHGKSDTASKRYPAWHFARNPDDEIMLLAHNDSLAQKFSRSCREVFREVAGPLFDVHISQASASQKTWEINGRAGVFHAAGIGGDIVGHGGNLIIIDDYTRDREEAESIVQREKTMDRFTDNIMTRRAPVCAVVIVVTRWHEDDLVGRIKEINDPKGKRYNKDFPVFHELSFPAQDSNGAWLFPERFSPEMYRSARAGMSQHAWTSEYMQDPVPRSGNYLHAESTVWHEPDEFWKTVRERGVRMSWGWDLASTRKEVTSPNPDYSAGTLAGVDGRDVYVGRVVRGRWRGAERNKIIEECARSTPGANVIIEVVAAYKEAYEHVRDMLQGVAIVTDFHPVVDKVARAECVEAPFEAGQVHGCRGGWNPEWVSELVAFPNGAHDDQVDSLITAVHDLLRDDGALDFDW